MLKRLTAAYENNINSYLAELFNNAPEIRIGNDSPLIIFSDLHMGNGKKNDDFRKNAGLLASCLEEYYLKKNYTLILNGDIEELQKFRMESISKAWKSTYKLFDKFAKNQKLIKIIGNHDDSILAGSYEKRYNEKKAVKLFSPNSDTPIFIFHGHQASVYYRYLNRFNSVLLRYIVNPIGIKNFAKKHKHQKKMRIENRSYKFSRENKLISIIGHTHRPLFESLSRADSLHFEIETLLRRYRKSNPAKRKQIAAKIAELKFRYDNCINSKPEYELASLMYSSGIPVPCLFNTGCAIGKRGITGIEITPETISLVHWFDSRISSRFLFGTDSKPASLPGNPAVHRVVLREDKLDYISDTIKLLGGAKQLGQSSGNQITNEFPNLIKNDTFENFSDETKQKLTLSC